jgi:hypothetical protein
METNNFYVYIHIRKDNGEPFYVGMGSKKWNRVSSKKNRNQWWLNITKKYGYDYIFLDENLTEYEAFELEKYWIKRIGRNDLGLGTLVNLTDGGEGKSGCKHTQESILKIKEKRKNQIITQKHKDKISISGIGRIVSQQTKEKISKLHLGSKRTEETKQKMRGHKTGNLVLNFETGIFYQSCREAATYCSLNSSTLKNMLSGRRTNKSKLRYV